MKSVILLAIINFCLFSSCSLKEKVRSQEQTNTSDILTYEELDTLTIHSLELLQQRFTQTRESANLTLIQYALGVDYFKKGYFEEAFSHFSNAENDIHKFEILEKHLPNFYHFIGLTYSTFNNHESAIIYQEKYAYHAQKLGMKKEYANSLFAIAGIHDRLGRHDEASKLYRKAIVVIDPMEIEPEFSFWWYYNLGYHFLTVKNYGKGVEYLRMALDLEKEREISYVSVYAYVGLGDLYQKIKKDSSIYYYEKAITINAEIAPDQKIQAYKGLGDVFREKVPSKAAFYYTKALDVSDKFEINRHRLELCDNLSSIYIKIGNKDEALKYLSLSNNYLKDLESEQRRIDLIINMAKEENLNKQNIDRLQSEQAFKEANIKSLRRNLIIVGTLILLLTFLAIKLFNSNNEKKNQNIILQEKNIQIQRQSEELSSAHKKILNQNKELEQKLIEKMLKVANENKMLSTLLTKINILSVAEESKNELSRYIKNYLNEDIWEEVDLQFAEKNQAFFYKLSSISLNLTENDYRLAAFIKMNISTKEIARLMHLAPSSVKVARSRLRKKLKINDINVKLVSYLNSL